MSEQKNNNQTDSSEIDVREVINIIASYIKLIKSSWVRIIVVSSIGAFIGIAYALNTTANYEAETSFMLEGSGDSGGLGKYASIAGVLGVSSGNSGINTKTLLSIMRSNRVLKGALMSVTELNGESNYIANHLMNVFEWVDTSDQDIKCFQFQSLDFKNFSFSEDSAMNQMTKFIRQSVITTVEDEDGLLKLVTLVPNQNLSKQFNDAVIKETSAYYVKNKIESEKSIVDIMKTRLDSVEIELKLAEELFTSHKDRHIATIKFEGNKELLKLQRDVQVLNIMYSELVKNIEIASFNLLSETPIIQVIDAPILPLPKIKTSPITGMFVGGFLFGFLLVIYIVWKKFSKDIMSD